MSIIGEAATAKVNIPEPTAPYVKYNTNGTVPSEIFLVGFTSVPNSMFYNIGTSN